MTTATKAGGAVLPVVGYFNSFGNALCKGVPRFSTDIALTPHALAQATIDELRAEVEALKATAQERALQHLSDNGQWIEEVAQLRSALQDLFRSYCSIMHDQYDYPESLWTPERSNDFPAIRARQLLQR